MLRIVECTSEDVVRLPSDDYAAKVEHDVHCLGERISKIWRMSYSS
jgi:hypothetical protein